MKCLHIRSEVAPRHDPEVVEKLDPVFIPETRQLALGLGARPKIVESDTVEISLAARQGRVAAEGDAYKPPNRVRIAVAEAGLNV
jgi:hypothetical protein